jgi:NADPH:quinone reductase-like Zn-dependent oxidoreductase
MLAIVAAPHKVEKLELREIAAPVPTSHEALVEVKALSLNRGECNNLVTAADGWRPGWDIAGIVRQAAVDGSGPKVGTRVVGLLPGAGWAQQAAVSTARLAPLPDAISFAQASTLPVAGLTALRALRFGNFLLGKRVLITGAAGGVGRYAIQLAAKAGAEVTGIVGNPERAKGLAELGTHTIINAIEEASGNFDLILESVGGTSLATALRLVVPRGVIVTFGNSSKQETVFNVNSFYGRSDARLIAYVLTSAHAEPFEADLQYLAQMIVAKELDPQISYQSNWQNAPEAVAALLNRQIAGKAVLHVE